MAPQRGRGAAAAAVAARAPTAPPPDSDSEPEVQDPPTGPAVIESPVKARAAKKGIAAKSDATVWALPDQTIIGSHLKC
jgi:hypothetical protein